MQAAHVQEGKNSIQHEPDHAGDFSLAERDFISHVSHDLRTPLAAIKAAIGVVLVNEPAGTTEPLRRMFQHIDHAADQMNSMIANIAEMARLRHQSDPLEREKTNLNDLVFEVAKTAESGARRREQHIDVEVPSKPCVALVDARRIERALLNLVENAERFGPAGSTIRICLERQGSEAVLSVIDQGPGIPEQQRLTILDGKSAGHSGLGLPVAQTVAALHGGRLWADPSPGSGATFRLALPCIGAARSAPSASKSAGKEGNG